MSTKGRTNGSVAGSPLLTHQLQTPHEVQQGGGPLKEHLDGGAKQRHLIEVEPEAAAGQPQAVVQQEGHRAHSIVEHEGEDGVVDQVAIHDAAPHEVTVCMHIVQAVSICDPICLTGLIAIPRQHSCRSLHVHVDFCAVLMWCNDLPDSHAHLVLLRGAFESL